MTRTEVHKQNTQRVRKQLLDYMDEQYGPDAPSADRFLMKRLRAYEIAIADEIEARIRIAINRELHN